ncbi:MAG: hypothetical protein HRT88_23355 [Lentisphaeraceae bacterium]|nr:hypothetical protein [Lentisphaeraceae bacterium]
MKDWLIISNLIWLTLALLIWQRGKDDTKDFKEGAQRLKKELDGNYEYYLRMDYQVERMNDKLLDFISVEEIAKVKAYDAP